MDIPIYTYNIYPNCNKLGQKSNFLRDVYSIYYTPIALWLCIQWSHCVSISANFSSPPRSDFINWLLTTISFQMKLPTNPGELKHFIEEILTQLDALHKFWQIQSLYLVWLFCVHSCSILCTCFNVTVNQVVHPLCKCVPTSWLGTRRSKYVMFYFVYDLWIYCW